MRSDVEPSTLMQARKRLHEDELLERPPARKHPRLEPKSPLPTPSPTVSSVRRPPTQRPLRRRSSATAFTQSEPKALKRAYQESSSDRAPVSKCRRKSSSPKPASSWFCDYWLQNPDFTSPISDIVPNIEAPPSTCSSVPDIRPASDQMSQQQAGDTPAPESVVSVQSERLNTASPMFRATLKMNLVVMDVLGNKIPQEVQEFVDKHIRKERSSPPLGNDEKARINEQIERGWNKAESMVADILKTPLFPLEAPDIAEGRDTRWSAKPLPRNPDYPYALPAPKPDRHYDFRTSETSNWTVQELSVADHPQVRPYSQPTRENLFPSRLIELKSEASGGTLYAGEGQTALDGAHRVRSQLWLLDQIDPTATRSCTDAIVFSSVVSQRETVTHVHYYNPEDGNIYVSYVDDFSFRKDPQGCRNHNKNLSKWRVQVQQPIIRDILRRVHPVMKSWKKGRPLSAVVDANESFGSEDGRLAKSQKSTRQSRRASSMSALSQRESNSQLVDQSGQLPQDSLVGEQVKLFIVHYSLIYRRFTDFLLRDLNAIIQS